MNTVGLRWTDATLPDEPADAIEDERGRPARCWRRMSELCERTRRLDQGRPFLEIVKDKNPVRARSRG